MCGIVGYIGNQQACPILMEGLSRLSYRGYDSAGVAILDDAGHINIHKAKGRLENLVAILETSPLSGSVGIGHTPLGYPWRTQRLKRSPAYRCQRRSCHSAQRYHREP